MYKRAKEYLEGVKKPMLIYHGGCADGFGAAWCFWHVFKDKFEYFEGNYGKPVPDVTGRDVYLVDFSYPRDVMEGILLAANHVVFIDHHISALQDLVDMEGLEYYVDLNRSGAMLAWDYLAENLLLPSACPQLLRHIQDRDLWKFKIEDTRVITAALFSYDYDFKVWDNLMLCPNMLDIMYHEGVAIERLHKKHVDSYIKASERRLVIAGHNVPVVNAPYTYASDIGNILSEGEPFAATYYDSQDRRVFSLRSKDGGLNVSEVAADFGGGGHLRAAGFSVARDHILALS
jgi:oligoribonuclease NrnB/cAMP/cGMP phosphodiesterase (DHH superfamily)